MKILILFFVFFSLESFAKKTSGAWQKTFIAYEFWLKCYERSKRQWAVIDKEMPESVVPTFCSSEAHNLAESFGESLKETKKSSSESK